MPAKYVKITKVIDGKVIDETVVVDAMLKLFKETLLKKKLVIWISGTSIQYSFTE